MLFRALEIRDVISSFLAQMVFDPCDLGLAPSIPYVRIATLQKQAIEIEVEREQKRARIDPPSAWVPSFPQVSASSGNTCGVPAHLKLFTLPPQPPHENVVDIIRVPEELPTFVLPLPEVPIDARRENFKTSKKFPMAGLLREEGGIFGWLDAQKAKETRTTIDWGEGSL
jgi:hypothetical protein